MMRLTIEREALAGALSFVAKYSGNGNAFPILGCVRLTAENGRLTVTATDLDRAASDAIDANIGADGGICLPAALLLKAVKSSSGADVRIAADQKQATVEIGKSRFTLPALPAEDFPPTLMLDGVGSGELVLPAGALERIANEVAYAVSTEATRYYLQGVCWRPIPGALVFGATDGKRLSRVQIDAPIGSDTMPEMIVPDFPLPAWDGPVSVVYSDTFVRFTVGVQSVASKLIEGTFPNIDRLIPTYPHSTETDREELLSAARRMAMMAETGEHSILIVGRDETLTLCARSARGEATETVRYTGADFQTAITSQHLIPTLESFDSENVELCWIDHTAPVLFRTPGGTDRLALVMPYQDVWVAEHLPKVAA